LNQELFSEFLATLVEGLGDTVRVEAQQVSGSEFDFDDLAIPILKKTQ
jgi:hypothetical protein